ncbi:hypothetical protein PRK78_002133 [Emydomyces testavorans]|uniref:Uncharacterized protein n=1 Tax=Emydomyces testavorans TaxID=2070801 RepID=A0AAF0DDW3_9EURO|nr:hypothetical protein PRK78_002133 [Emydomyces testavorans]
MTTVPPSHGDIGRSHGDRSTSSDLDRERLSVHRRRSWSQEEISILPSSSTASKKRVEFDQSPRSATAHRPRASSAQDHGFEDISEDGASGDEMHLARPSLSRPAESRSNVPLLKDERRGRPQSATFAESVQSRGVSGASRRSSFRSKAPDYDANSATRRKYIIASFFLVLSLISFTVQTQTAVFIQQELGWNKPYCML